jgi:hypothetical protein
MKNLLISFLLVALQALPLIAQKDTTFILQSTAMVHDSIQPSMLLEVRNEVLKLQEPVRTLFKFNVLSLTPLLTGRNPFLLQTGASLPWPIDLQVAAEQKIGNAFSIGVHLNANLISNDYSEPGITPASDHVFLGNFSLQPELRWYYFMKRWQKNGVQGSNLAGPYVSANYRWVHYRNGAVRNSINNIYGGILMFGIQHRLFNRAYFDLGYGLGISRSEDSPSYNNKTTLNSVLRVQVGFALSKPKRQNVTAPNYCEALRCYREEHHLLKFDLLNLIDFNTNGTVTRINFRPNMAFEQKIGQSAFSVEGALNLNLWHAEILNIQTTPAFVGDGQNIGVELVLQPRYYFQMKRNIAKGKAGNNLNGMYLGLHNGFRSNWFQYNSSTYSKYSTKTETLNLAFLVGCQYRFLRRGFADFFIGAGRAFSHSAVKQDSQYLSEANSQDLLLISKFRVGMAF